MRTIKLGAACLAAVTLSGCWLEPFNGAAHQNANLGETTLTPANVASLAPAWSVAVDDGVGGQPLVTGGAVYVAGDVPGDDPQSFVVTARARGTGAPLWRREFPNGGSNGDRILSVADGKVLLVRFSPTDGLVFEELDGATGDTLRSAPLAFRADAASVVVAGDLIAYLSLNPVTAGLRITVQSRENFVVLWTADLAVNPEIPVPLVIADNLLFEWDETSTGTVLRAFLASGCGPATCPPVWTRTLPTVPGATVEFYDSEAATDDGTMLITHAWLQGRTSHEDLLSFDRSGNAGPTISLTAIGAVAVAGTRRYFTGVDAATPAGGRTLFAYEGATLLWRAEGPAGMSGRPLVAGGVVYVPESGAGIRAFAADGCGAATCSPVTTVDLGPGVFLDFSVTFGTLFVSSSGADDRLTALTPAG
jgi:outer membrane protein assembly factor BamB